MITIINKDMYKKMYNIINGGDMIQSNSTMIAAGICYILLAICIYYFIIRDNISSYQSIFTRGAILGLIIYGVYNSTNKVTINKYGTYEAIIDTIWGTLLCGIISVLASYIYKKYII